MKNVIWMNAQKIFLCFAISLFAVFVYFKSPSNTAEKPTKLCYQDLIKNSSICNLACPNGTFALPGMNYCHPWLNCDAKITLVSIISTSVVKTIYLAKWEGLNVALSVLSAKEYGADFQQNLFMIKSLTGKSIIQLLGFCNNAILTKYHELGSALNANHHLRNSLRMHDNLKVRLNLCISYVSVLEQLHSSPVGVRVMCDSNTLTKTLSQYLLTEDFKLVANDLDATPQVISKGVICGNQAITGPFVAPEQLWPYGDEEYDSKRMPSYDEKTDIYKIPDICNWFLGGSSEADVVKYKLFTTHKNCKHNDPTKRPNATVVLDIYRRVLNDLFSNM